MENKLSLSDFGKPGLDEVEVTIIGGGLNGESIVVHAGNNNWVIIDSCCDGDKPIAISYLESIGVDPEHHVRAVVCTHWHLDHIQGLPKIVGACKNASVYIPNIGNMSDLLSLADPDGITEDDGSMIWEIFTNVKNILEERKSEYNLASCNTQIFSEEGFAKLIAMSPSTTMMIEEREQLINKTKEQLEANPKARIVDSNLGSVSILLKTDRFNIILGADLEKESVKKDKYTICPEICDERRHKGWCNIFHSADDFKRSPSFSAIKIPHHSSVNGFCPKLWKDETEPKIAVSTLYTAKKRLPSSEMLKKYKTIATEYYLTSKHSNTIESIDGDPMNDLFSDALEVQNVEIGYGIVCLRRSIKGDIWKKFGFGKAIMVDDVVIDEYSKWEEMNDRQKQLELARTE